MTLLSLSHVEASYGGGRVLNGVSLRLAAGQVVALMGRNGMGKTTTVRAIMGLAPWMRGQITFDGRDIGQSAPHRIARAGIGLVPEGRHVFANLTVRENLIATARSGRGWALERVLELLPQLGARYGAMARTLSGGEQQMLAIGRALLTNPALLILDEATEGLSPKLRDEIYACLAAVRQSGMAVLLIDKHVAALSRLADRAIILEKGRVTWEGAAAELPSDATALGALGL